MFFDWKRLWWCVFCICCYFSRLIDHRPTRSHQMLFRPESEYVGRDFRPIRRSRPAWESNRNCEGRNIFNSYHAFFIMIYKYPRTKNPPRMCSTGFQWGTHEHRREFRRELEVRSLGIRTAAVNVETTAAYRDRWRQTGKKKRQSYANELAQISGSFAFFLIRNELWDLVDFFFQLRSGICNGK